jgi:hypothetical protein
MKPPDVTGDAAARRLGENGQGVAAFAAGRAV